MVSKGKPGSVPTFLSFFLGGVGGGRICNDPTVVGGLLFEPGVAAVGVASLHTECSSYITWVR